MKYLLGLLVTTMLVAYPAGSKADHDPQQLGPYVGVGASAGFSDFTRRARDYGDSAGFNIVAGYRWHDYFAIEGLYEYMDDFGRTQHVGINALRLRSALHTHNFSLLGKIMLPLPG